MTAYKRPLAVLVGIVCLAGMFVAADYLGLFGVRESTSTDFFDFRVRTLDAETGREIGDVKIRCFQYGTTNACGQPPSRERGVVRVSLLVEKHVRESLLFTHAVRYSPVREEELRIMFIHGDYDKPVQRYDIPDLLARPERTFSVEMKPLAAAGAQENDA